MTNKEAIEVLNNWDMACPICEKRKSEEKGVCADCRFNNALNFAIKALEERPQGDLISREALRKEFDDYIKANPNVSGIFELGKFIIDNAPTVEAFTENDKALAYNMLLSGDVRYYGNPMNWESTKGDLISREALKTALANNTLIRDFNLQFDGIIGEIIDNAPTVSFMISPDYVTELNNLNKELIKQLEEDEFTDLERKVTADAINYLLGAELLEENGYTEEVINALKSVLQKIGAEENHL